MALAISCCGLPNAVPEVVGAQPDRFFSVRITGLGNEIGLGNPYNITVKNSSNVIVTSWVYNAPTGSVGVCTVSPPVTPADAPGDIYTVEVHSVGAGITLTQPAFMDDLFPLAGITYDIALTATCSTGLGDVTFTFTGPIPEIYVLYDSFGNQIGYASVSTNSLFIPALAPGNYNILFRYPTQCNPPLPSSCFSSNNWQINFEVTTENVPIQVDGTTTPTICPGSTGSITVAPRNGTGPYTYDWVDVFSNPYTGNPLTNLDGGTYYLTITDANGCTGQASFNVGFDPTTCGNCYSLTDCFPGAAGSPTYYVYNDTLLANMDGYIINGVVITGQYVDPTKCWLVTSISGDIPNCSNSLPLESFDEFYSECDPCQFVPEEVIPPPPQSHNEPVHIFYDIAESPCDIQAIKQFAGGISSLVKKLRYGITDCCKSYNQEQLWVNKQMSDMSAMVIAGYECRSTPNAGCGWLPLSTCEICPNTTGGTTILAIAGEDILFGKLVMLSNDGKLYLNDPTSALTYQRCIGFTTMDVLKNQTTRILVMGLYTNVNWSLTAGTIYYASATGNITSTIPANPPLEISQMIGTATSSTTLLVDIKQPILI